MKDEPDDSTRPNDARGAMSRDESAAHSHVPLDADRPPNSGWDDLEQRWVPTAEAPQRNILRLGAAAHYLGISPATLRRLADSGEIFAHKDGDPWRKEPQFYVPDLDAWRRGEVQPSEQVEQDAQEPEPMTRVYIELDERWCWHVFREGDSYIPDGLQPVEVLESNVEAWLRAERLYNNAQRAIKELWPDDPDKRQS